MFGKKKSKKQAEEEPEDKLPQGDEEEDLEEEQEEAVEEPKQKLQGTFTLNPEEMSLAVNALASSEEFKLYQRILVGQKIGVIIQGYQTYLQQQKNDVGETE